MNSLSLILDVALTLAAFSVPIVLVVLWLDRGTDSALGDALDASAATLWPVVPEEDHSPRWRVELIGEGRQMTGGAHRRDWPFSEPVRARVLAR